jgi:putative tryptophan/tyrosine transport system substrate-binding protein
MKRRDLLSLFGGAAVSWPLGAEAQQGALPVIGFLSARGSQTDAPLLRFFREGLKQSGYAQDENVLFEYRGALGEYDRLAHLALELIERHVQVIVTFGGLPSALAAKSSTTTIPIVFVSGDPIREGLVTGFNRPGGNITGVTTLSEDLAPKQFALASELLPHEKPIAVLVNPAHNVTENVRREVLGAGQSLGRQVAVLNAGSTQEIEACFERMHSDGAGGALVTVDPFFFTQANLLVQLASRHLIPTVFFRREFCEAGGLMCYGASSKEAYVQVGIYAGRILKGVSPADLPIVQSVTYELVINQKTAKALGVTVPPMLLARADEVIE